MKFVFLENSRYIFLELILIFGGKSSDDGLNLALEEAISRNLRDSVIAVFYTVTRS